MKKIPSLFSLELTGFIFILLFLFFVSYCLFLRSALIQNATAESNLRAQQHAFIQKKQFARADATTQQSLAQWKNKHPIFFDAMQAPHSIDLFLQTLTRAAEQSGFSILEAAPLQIKKHTVIHMQLNGHYQNLFYFIHALNQLAWPFTIDRLTISNKNQFELSIKMPRIAE